MLNKIKPVTWVISALLAQYAWAEEPAQIRLDNISVTDKGASDQTTPAITLNGHELNLRRGSTLGETLNSLPGVSATGFGPNASRPVIRGMDAERVKIMQNGVGVLDVSSLSFDHAVSVDPLVIEQIDVVRGPAALLYGSSAIGGVVNATDHRIPQEQLEGITGRAETRFGGAENMRNGAAVVDAGNGQFAIHGDVYTRKTSDLDIPGFAVSSRKNAADGTPRVHRGTLINSDADADGSALGGALTFDNGYIGLSYARDNNNYGTVAEENVRIDMKSDRWDVASEFTDLGTTVNRLKFRMAHTDYEHKELEGVQIGTTFKNRGLEGSLEAGHNPVFGLNGVIGFQFGNTNFEAIGKEAFVPSVNTQNQALYLYEERPIDKHKLTFGWRLGHTSVDSRDSASFGSGQNNSFNPNSLALGGLYSISSNWSATANLSHNERAPAYFELYANGPHVATGQFEVGNSNLQKERSNGIDAQLRWRDGHNSFNFGAYYTRFSNYIGVFDTGNIEPITGLPEARFDAVRAVFKGLEFDGKYGLTDNLDLTVRGDYVHARDKTNNEYLPRIAPLRLGAGLRYQLGNFSAHLDALHAFKQSKTAVNELKTSAYTDVSATVAYKLPVHRFHVEAFAKANNLLNEEIRDHASFLKNISPAGERSLLIGARADF